MSLSDLSKKMAKKPKKTAGSRASARVREEPPVTTLESKKLPKVLRTLLDAITDDDVDMVVKVWREAMVATRSFWRESGRDPETKKSIGEWVTEPDHRTRLEASKLVAAYKEGLPIQRQAHFHGTFEDLGQALGKLASSPEGARALASLGEPEIIDIESTVQETGAKPAAILPRDWLPDLIVQQSNQ